MDVEKYLKRKKRNEEIVFDKVKVFRRYFPKNNVDVVLKGIDDGKTKLREYCSIVRTMDGKTIYTKPFQI